MLSDDGIGRNIEVTARGEIARVVSMLDDGCQATLEYASGSMATVTSQEPLPYEVGAVLLVNGATSEAWVVSSDLWPDKPWVGVVRIKRDDLTVVEVNGSHRLIDCTPEVDYEPGNTVLGSDSVGITRVLDEKPLRLFEPPGVDSSTLASFKVPLTKGGGPRYIDFAGLDAVVERARELVEAPLKYRGELAAIGARPIKGVLFTGDPGTGKTYLARIIANEAGAKFYEISGPQIFSKWVGESEEVLRRIFEDAAEQERSIIFFDEIDSVAGQREGAHEASVRVVAQLLTLMDGFTQTDNVVVIAATNRPDDIDVALRRPGRFDLEIYFPLPSLRDRAAILRYYEAAHTTRGDLPLDEIARRTESWSAAELAAIWKEAALLAAMDQRSAILGDDCIGGFERVAAQHGRAQSRAIESGQS